MKKILKPTILPIFTLCASALGLLLRIWLMGTGIDKKGLLIQHHPAGVAVFILTALVMAVLFLCTHKLGAIGRYTSLFPNNKLESVGSLIAALGILYVNARDLTLRRDSITTMCLVLGILAAVSLVVVALLRFRKRRPACYFHGIVTLYLMAHLVSQYRLWSAEPQLQLYFFPLLASVFLMLATYHLAVLNTRKDSRTWYLLCNQSALFFCLISVFSENVLFYLTMSVWMFCTMCSVEPNAPEKAKGA